MKITTNKQVEVTLYLYYNVYIIFYFTNKQVILNVIKKLFS